MARKDLDVVEIPVTRDCELEKMEVLEEAIKALAEHDPRWAEIVQLRYFIGFTIDQTAQTLGI